MEPATLGNSLAELALDLSWAWHHGADPLWAALNPELWSQTHNAWVVLQSVSPARIENVFARPELGQRLDQVIADRRQTAEREQWFDRTWPASKLTAVAYFSMEFMLSDSLPIYSGGLGNVAGDQLKSANDLGVPVIGVGLLYQQGYFRQRIDATGSQIALRPFNDPGQLPVEPVRAANGEWLRITHPMPGDELYLRVWQAQVGRTKLYLLDTNDPGNAPEFRGIVGELYGGGPETRLAQEAILGIAGWRLLRSLGIRPEVCHLNEGHAAFAVLERARCFMEDNGQPFEVALAATRAGNLFTTHTPVAAGFDRFAPELMAANMRPYAERELCIPFARFMALGRLSPDDEREPFNMAYLATRGSLAVNGVSRLHGEVSRRIFQPLFPRWPEREVPIGHVTNGIHTPTWDSPDADEVWTGLCGKARWRAGNLETLEASFRSSPELMLWNMRQRARRSLIDYLRERLARQVAGHGGSEQDVGAVRRALDPDTLTIGFARRFATYKRPNLLLHDQDRLLRMLTNRERPVQLVLAGKAHPADAGGQAMIREWIEFIRRTPARSQAVFVADDDMTLTEHLVAGVDVWLNMPRRPWEASGTSGMKVLVNGGLNFSELDGWWAEAYSPDVGWALGDGREHGEDPAWDAAEAEEMYARLEQEIIPEFYDRDSNGVPSRWVFRMRESMARLTPQYSAIRAVQDYARDYYAPLAESWLQRESDHGALAAQILSWSSRVDQHWPRLRFGPLDISAEGAQKHFTVQLWIDELSPDSIAVELYADARDGGVPERHEMQRGDRLPGSEGGYAWTAAIGGDRRAEDYTPRVVPRFRGAATPLESQKILWYR